jgi:hypothetical protein
MTNFRSSELTFVSDQKAENIDIATSQKSQLESAAGQESTASSNIPAAEGKSKTLDEYRYVNTTSSFFRLLSSF